MTPIEKNSKEHRLKAVVTGLFFITATTAAITGLKLYDPILQNQNFLAAGASMSSSIRVGAIFELILASANIGTGVMLYPYLKKYSASWGLAYALFRLLEVVFILIGIVSILTILSICNDYATASEDKIASLQSFGNTLKVVHGWTFILGPHFMLGINTFIYSFIFYRTKLVPRKLSILGIAGAVLILLAALFEIFGLISHFSVQTVLLAIPIAVFEMALATRLIARGYNLDAYKQIITEKNEGIHYAY
ncbi:DUF4386 domain-containing protein [Flavihumibacter sp. UBA7668]|uniref:DUF4386 domain-containing protein n=1 Tax=Flavihumibacter sp. UBA7668 TaxID=1946542 RepID=UPI0025BCF69B|nr:DUF4386 domain-containing protein [Flavihumibacter sp. UBA7668]